MREGQEGAMGAWVVCGDGVHRYLVAGDGEERRRLRRCERCEGEFRPRSRGQRRCPVCDPEGERRTRVREAGWGK